MSVCMNIYVCMYVCMQGKNLVLYSGYAPCSNLS